MSTEVSPSSVRESELCCCGGAGLGATNLFSALWDEIQQYGANLVTLRKGYRLVHDFALVQLISHLPRADLHLVAQRKRERIAGFTSHGLILCGNPYDFADPTISHVLKSAGYPGRFEVLPPGPRAGIRPIIEDRLGEASDAAAGTFLSRVLEQDLGLIFAGQTQDLRRAPVVVVAGTSRVGLLAAATWATEVRMLKRIAVPDAFPAHPLEVIVGLAAPRNTDCAEICLPEITLKVMVCCDLVYDVRRWEWSVAHPETVRLVSDSNGRPRAIHVGSRSVKSKPGADLFELLWLLAERSAKGRWISLEEAATIIDKGVPKKGRRQTLKARLADIRDLSSSCNFVQMRFDPEKRRHVYRLNAYIIFQSAPSATVSEEPLAPSAAVDEPVDGEPEE